DFGFRRAAVIRIPRIVALPLATGIAIAVAVSPGVAVSRARISISAARISISAAGIAVSAPRIATPAAVATAISAAPAPAAATVPPTISAAVPATIATAMTAASGEGVAAPEQGGKGLRSRQAHDQQRGKRYLPVPGPVTSGLKGHEQSLSGLLPSYVIKAERRMNISYRATTVWRCSITLSASLPVSSCR
ncbi:MAG TPA: hypothetical protein VFZ03_09650, partial [Dongiaceae bacterium]